MREYTIARPPVATIRKNHAEKTYLTRLVKFVIVMILSVGTDSVLFIAGAFPAGSGFNP